MPKFRVGERVWQLRAYVREFLCGDGWNPYTDCGDSYSNIFYLRDKTLRNYMPAKSIPLSKIVHVKPAEIQISYVAKIIVLY